jgi:diacylglycerol kinase family enzyme
VSSAIGALGSRLGLHAEDAPKLTKHERIRFTTDEPLPVHLDAEPFGSTPLTISVRRGALRLLVPDSTPKGLFRAVGE